MKTNVCFLSYLTQFLLEWEMFQTNFAEEIKTHFVFSEFFENFAIYDITWKTTVQPDRPQMTI